MKQLMEVMGAMDTLFSAAQAHQLDKSPAEVSQTQLAPSQTAVNS